MLTLKLSASKLHLTTLAKRLYLAVVVAVFLSATAVSVYASQIYWNGTNQYGESYWTVCGSSAGNYEATCYPDGHCDINPEGHASQVRSDLFCSLPE